MKTKHRLADPEILDRVDKMERLSRDIKDTTRFSLREGESIVTAFAERASGPGWSNQPIRVILRDRIGALREVWIQPHDQTDEMHYLYKVSDAIHVSMSRAVAALVIKQHKKMKSRK